MHDPRTGYILHNKYHNAVTGYGIPIRLAEGAE